MFEVAIKQTLKEIENELGYRVKIVDKNRITKSPFWRNDVVDAWCLSKCIGTDVYADNEIWIGFYDNGKIKVSVSAYDGMCDYKFNKFYDEATIENDIDWNTHVELLKMYNWLIDNEVVEVDNV